ncbi:MAG TPA: TatD family hydrolase [Holophagaceae bacterium]|nr:TatD family hydrolase [Holophagaceae bacterium]
MRPFDAHMHFREPEAAPDWDLVCCGTHPAQWPEVLAWAARAPRVRPCLGLHPWWLRHAGEGWAEALEAALRNSRAGVGECGLDGAMVEADPAAQLAALRVHVRLARELDRPLVLHVVRAWGRLDALLKEEPLPRRVMVHAFSGSPETAAALQRRGIFLSFAPLGHRSVRIQAALRAADPALLLLESDAEDPRGQAALPDWVTAAAACRGEDADALGRRCAENARRCFEGVSA